MCAPKTKIEPAVADRDLKYKLMAMVWLVSEHLNGHAENRINLEI